MSVKVIITSITIVSTLGILYYLVCCFDPLGIDVDKIIKETRQAYENVRFEKEPFLQKEEIQDFSDFLLRHIDEIKNYNKHEEYRKVQLTEGSWTSHYKNTGDCFGMPTFHASFIKDYFPPELIDSLIYYSKGLKNELIVGLSVCSENYKNNVDPTKGSVSYALNYQKKDKMNGSYYLSHGLSINRKFRLNNTIKTVYDYGLTKDTTLTEKLKYTIAITPYSGF